LKFPTLAYLSTFVQTGKVTLLEKNDPSVHHSSFAHMCPVAGDWRT